jgi:hypothetical protein
MLRQWLGHGNSHIHGPIEGATTGARKAARQHFVNFPVRSLGKSREESGMRILAAALVISLCLAGAFACSRAQPPVGRWEGTYESGDVMIAARVEIDPRGNIYVSAPDTMNFPAPSADERAAMHARLAQGLANAWGAVQPRRYDFDGSIFRKAGGIAPQMEWEERTKRMTLIVYLERRPGIRIPLRPVSEFSADPWTGMS